MRALGTYLPRLDDVRDAGERLEGIAIRTPLVRHDALDRRAGARVWVKAECLQITGSFKIRGAANRIAQLSADQRKAGVVAFSSGNHAQGVARAARLTGIPAVIVMPYDAPAVKIEGARADGAEIRLYDRETESREAIAAAIADERAATLVPSYDDPDIIAGQGTLGLDLLAQAEEAGISFNHLLCCAGGGGLISGISLAFEAGSPSTRLWTCEPAGFDDWARSLAAGEIRPVEPGKTSICDAILTPRPGDLPFALGRDRLSGGLVVSDQEVCEAMRFAFRHLKLVVEPGGAVALAAALRGLPETMQEQTVCLILTGGNVDPDLYANVIAGEPSGSGSRARS